MVVCYSLQPLSQLGSRTLGFPAVVAHPPARLDLANLSAWRQDEA